MQAFPEIKLRETMHLQLIRESVLTYLLCAVTARSFSLQTVVAGNAFEVPPSRLSFVTYNSNGA